MTLVTKVVGRMPTSKFDWDPNYVNPDTGQNGYGLKFRAIRYGCELESLMENNTYDPISWDGAETFIIDTAHWQLVSGNPKVWAAGNPKPASTGTSGDYPYNGLGRVVIQKNMVNIAEQGEPENIVNLLTQEAFEDGEGNPLTNTVFVIQYDFVLGEDIEVPANCVLEFDGGSISGNGANKDTLTGDKTVLHYNSTIFDSVTIKGTWNVDVIKTSMFANCTSQDVLKNLFALQNNNIYNEIIVERASSNYIVGLGEDVDNYIIGSNTKLIINGNIEIVSNSSPAYRIISLYGRNIQVVGSGKIIGDRLTHTYTGGSTHEQGHGLFIGGGCSDVIVEGLEICNCTGDAIFQRTTCKNVVIRNVELHHCRRQGITVQGVDNIIIENFNIHDIGTSDGIEGTDPQSGIDIEPNKGEGATVRNVTIRNGKITNCKDGIENSSTLSLDEDRVYENISISNIVISNMLNSGIQLEYARNISVKNCIITSVILGIVNRCDINIEGCTITTTTDNGVAFYNSKDYRTAIKNCNTTSHKVVYCPNNILIEGSNCNSTKFHVDGGDVDGAWCKITTSKLAFTDNDGTEACMSITDTDITCKYLQFGHKCYLENNNITGTASSSFVALILYNGSITQGKYIIINNRINAGNGVYKYIIQIAANTKSAIYGNDVNGYNYDGRFVSSYVGNYIKDFSNYAAFGTTAERPVFDQDRDVDETIIGLCFLDTSLSPVRPIWYKGGGVWVDAAGTPV